MKEETSSKFATYSKSETSSTSAIKALSATEAIVPEVDFYNTVKAEEYAKSVKKVNPHLQKHIEISKHRKTDRWKITRNSEILPTKTCKNNWRLLNQKTQQKQKIKKWAPVVTSEKSTTLQKYNL